MNGNAKRTYLQSLHLSDDRHPFQFILISNYCMISSLEMVTRVVCDWKWNSHMDSHGKNSKEWRGRGERIGSTYIYAPVEILESSGRPCSWFSRSLRMQHHQDSHLKIFGRDCITALPLGVNLDDAASANDCVHHLMHYTKLLGLQYFPSSKSWIRFKKNITRQ